MKASGMITTADDVRFSWSLSIWTGVRGSRCVCGIDPPVWHKGWSRRRDARRAMFKVVKQLKLKLVNPDRL